MRTEQASFWQKMRNAMKTQLVQDIIEECEQKRYSVSEDLLDFLVNLLLSNPEYEYVNDNVCKSDLPNLVGIAVSRLSNPSRPSLIILKLQLYYIQHYATRDQVISRHRKRVHTKIMPLLKEICQTTLYKACDRDVQKLYHKLVAYIILLGGLGNPSVLAVVKETRLALQSVYRISELAHFVSLPNKRKEQQLSELTCIVAGICLLNRDSQRCGEGIDNLPSILQEEVASSQSSVMHALEKIMNKVYSFTAAAGRIISSKSDNHSESSAKDWSENIKSENIKWVIEMLAAGRQEEIYVRKISNEIKSCDRNIQNLMKRLQERLFDLRNSIHYKSEISTAKIYPRFIGLTVIWMRLQDELAVLNHIKALLWELQSLTTKSIDTFDDSLLTAMINKNRILTDAERLEASMGKLITDVGECSVFYPNITKDFDQIHLEYLGFCPWSFVEGDGALIPGNPNIGVVHWQGKYFAFSSIKAAQEFGVEPERFVKRILRFACHHPEYIHLLQIYEDMKLLRNKDKQNPTPEHKMQQDQSIQTELHPIVSNIVENYTSSTWEYRRRALRLANICRCATHSGQTNVSYFRTGVIIDAVRPKSGEVQTKRGISTNTEKIKNFRFGWRGRGDDNQHVLSLVEN